MPVNNYTNDGTAQAAFQTAAARGGVTFTNLSLVGQIQAVLANLLNQDSGNLTAPISTTGVGTFGTLAFTGSAASPGASTRYIGPGGLASSLSYNVPAGHFHYFNVNDVSVFGIYSDAVALFNSGYLSKGGTGLFDLRADGAGGIVRVVNPSYTATLVRFIETGQVDLCANVAVPAGGSTAGRVLVSTTAGLGLYFGSGAPTVSAAQGSIYIRTDGSSTSTRLYVNTNGTTGWTSFTSAT